MIRAFCLGFLQGLLTIGALLVDNARGLMVLVGATWLYVGVAGFSRPAANIVGGVLLLSLGAYPYLRPKRKA